MDGLQIVTEPRRREILRLTWTQERSVGELARACAVTMGAVSQHLAVLRDAGYVAVRKVGNHRFYRANPDGLGELRPVLEAMWAATLDHLAATIEADQATDGRP